MVIERQKSDKKQKTYTMDDYKKGVDMQRARNRSTMNKENALLYSIPVLLPVGLIVASLLT